MCYTQTRAESFPLQFYASTRIWACHVQNAGIERCCLIQLVCTFASYLFRVIACGVGIGLALVYTLKEMCMRDWQEMRNGLHLICLTVLSTPCGSIPIAMTLSDQKIPVSSDTEYLTFINQEYRANRQVHKLSWLLRHKFWKSAIRLIELGEPMTPAHLLDALTETEVVSVTRDGFEYSQMEMQEKTLLDLLPTLIRFPISNVTPYLERLCAWNSVRVTEYFLDHYKPSKTQLNAMAPNARHYPSLLNSYVKHGAELEPHIAQITDHYQLKPYYDSPRH